MNVALPAFLRYFGESGFNPANLRFLLDPALQITGFERRNRSGVRMMVKPDGRLVPVVGRSRGGMVASIVRHLLAPAGSEIH